MHLTITIALEVVTATGTVASLFYYALSTAGLVSFLRARRQTPPATQLPPISILKPLKGVDSLIWESFVSHCEQDYPQLQLIFGVSDPDDPAIPLVHKLQNQFPTRQIDLLECPQILGTNVKVSNLVQMLPAARHEILLVNDSDIRVPPTTCAESWRRSPTGMLAWSPASTAASPPKPSARASKPSALRQTSCPESSAPASLKKA